MQDKTIQTNLPRFISRCVSNLHNIGRSLDPLDFNWRVYRRGDKCFNEHSVQLNSDQIAPFIEAVESGIYTPEQKSCYEQKIALATGHALASIHLKKYILDDLLIDPALDEHSQYLELFKRLAMTPSAKLIFHCIQTDAACAIFNELNDICSNNFMSPPQYEVTSVTAPPDAYTIQLSVERTATSYVPHLSFVPGFTFKGGEL